jgi:hypothetical protein
VGVGVGARRSHATTSSTTDHHPERVLTPERMSHDALDGVDELLRRRRGIDLRDQIVEGDELAA